MQPDAPQGGPARPPTAEEVASLVESCKAAQLVEWEGAEAAQGPLCRVKNEDQLFVSFCFLPLHHEKTDAPSVALRGARDGETGEPICGEPLVQHQGEADGSPWWVCPTHGSLSGALLLPTGAVCHEVADRVQTYELVEMHKEVIEHV